MSIKVSAVAVPNEIEKNNLLQPKTFKTIQTTKEGRYVYDISKFIIKIVI